MPTKQVLNSRCFTCTLLDQDTEIGEELTVGSGRVLSQDREAYYVGFQRKAPRPHRGREVVVKVYKKNGLAEWEEY